MRAIWAFCGLALGAAGCERWDSSEALPAISDAGRAPQTDPITGASLPPSPNDPGTKSDGGPAPGAAGCNMHEDEKQVCVTCLDAKGNVVRDGCYTKEPHPAGAECHDIKRMDGSLCTVCFDALGGVVKSSCRAPDANGCAMPGTPPPPPIACKEYDDKGQRCTVCTDASGQVVKAGCSEPAMPGGASCDETKHADGTVCTTCRDAKGEVVKKGCTGPMPPPDPAGITCSDVEEKGMKCTVCKDATGKEIKRGCWSTSGEVPPAPACKEYRSEDGQLCVICLDPKGNVVKQSCGAPPAGMPGYTGG